MSGAQAGAIGAVQRPAAAELRALARQLHLTMKQQRFAEAWAADPDGNATRAARRAGCGRSAKVTACRWLRSEKMRTYLEALSGAAVAEAERRTERAVVTLADVFERLVAQMECREPAESITRRASNDARVTVTRIFKPLTAALGLAQLLARAEGAVGHGTTADAFEAALRKVHAQSSDEARSAYLASFTALGAQPIARQVGLGEGPNQAPPSGKVRP